MAVFEGIRRAGPPIAVQKLREGLFLVQVSLSEVPTADWKRLFYDAQPAPPADFPPRSVEMMGPALRFRCQGTQVEEKVKLLDSWIARANQKEASLGGRDEERQRRREELAREQAELAHWNARWTNL